MNFLKRLFGKKEEVLEFSQLPSWLVKTTEFSIATEVKELKEAIVMLDTATKNLEEFDVDSVNLEIPPRFRGKVEGNKRAYVKSLQSFHKETKIPEAFDSKSLKEYYEDFQERTKSFNQKTIKNYHVMKTILGKPLDEAVKSVKRISDAVSKINSATKKYHLETVESIHKRIKEINDTLLANKDVEKELQRSHKERGRLVKEETNIQRELEDLKNGSLFKQYTQLKINYDDFVKQREDLRSTLISKIIPLERDLKKYSKGSLKSKDIEKLLKDKEQFVLKSPSKVVAILKDLENAIDKGSFESKDGKKTIISAKSLANFSSNYNDKAQSLEQSVKKVQKDIASNLYEKKLQAVLKRLDENTQTLTAVMKAENSIESRDLKKDILYIEKALKKMGYSVKIKHEALD